MYSGDAPLGAANPRIKQLRRLSGRRSSRLEEGAFIIEGAVLVREALAAGVALQSVFVDADRTDLVHEFEALATDLTVVSSGVLGSVLPTVAPQPVCAVASIGVAVEPAAIAARAAATQRPVVVLVDVADPGNVGTLLRAAESSGCVGMVLAGTSVDLFNPKVVRSSAGSVFRMAVAVETSTVAVLDAFSEAGVPSLAAVAGGGVVHLQAVELGGAVAIVLGNEAHGLATETIAACESAVTIAMDGPTESLNVAMAGTVLCFEALRRRLATPQFTGRRGGEPPA